MILTFSIGLYYFGHGEEGAAKFEAEEAMERLPIDVGRCCSSEGSEDDVRTVGVITRLTKDSCYHIMQGVNQSGLSRACTTVDNDQGG